MRKATEVVDRILRAYPDYGKAPPAYVAALVEVVAGYPISFHDAFADMKTGIPSRTKYLPTAFDFAEMAKELQATEDRRSRLDALQQRVAQARLTAPEGEYRPQQPARYYDRHNVEITPGEALDRLERHEREKAGIKRATEMTAYVKHLGNGDALVGWQIAIERGISEPPLNWREDIAA